MSAILVTLEKAGGAKIAFWMPVGKPNGKRRSKVVPIKLSWWAKTWVYIFGGVR